MLLFVLFAVLPVPVEPVFELLFQFDDEPFIDDEDDDGGLLPFEPDDELPFVLPLVLPFVDPDDDEPLDEDDMPLPDELVPFGLFLSSLRADSSLAGFWPL